MRGGSVPQKVFISYSSRDDTPELPQARQLVAALQDRGITCWFAPRWEDSPPGQEFAEAILEGLQESMLVVLLFSSHSHESPYVRREIALAVQQRLPIIAVRLEELNPTGSMAFHLAGITWLDAWDLPPDAWHEAVAMTVGAYLRPELSLPLHSLAARTLKVDVVEALAAMLYGNLQEVRMVGVALRCQDLVDRYLERPQEVLDSMEDMCAVLAQGSRLRQHDVWAVLPIWVHQEIIVVVGLTISQKADDGEPCRRHVRQLAGLALQAARGTLVMSFCQREITLPASRHARRRQISRFFTEIVRDAKTSPGDSYAPNGEQLPSEPLTGGGDDVVATALAQICRDADRSPWKLPRVLDLPSASFHLRQLVVGPEPR
jgi:hypothetical protein